jgi:hypothetical protein
MLLSHKTAIFLYLKLCLAKTVFQKLSDDEKRKEVKSRKGN